MTARGGGPPGAATPGAVAPSRGAPLAGEGGARPWVVLALLSLAVLLGMSAWFTATAAAPELRVRWGLDGGEVAWLTTVVQLGFVGGTAVAAVLNLADVVPSRVYFTASALLAGAANGALLAGPSYPAALALRFLTGFFLAGVYPPAMKMTATWFRSSRGLAIGTLVGALTVGKAAPYLLKALGGTSLAAVVGGASAAAVAAALLVGVGYRDGPYPFARRPFSWGLVGGILRHRTTMLATAGYLGHMWELYAMWTLVPSFFLDFYLRRGLAEGRAEHLAASVGFAVIAAGGIGCVVAGRWADRWGRERVASGAMIVSGACALTVGWLVDAPPWIVIALGLVWGFAVVADSAQFSALVTEVAPQHAVGTALTLQTMLGFALTGFSIQGATALSGRVGWGVAFAVLAVGPALGVAAMGRLLRLRTRGRSAMG